MPDVTHPTPETLRIFVNGFLPDAEQEAIEAHLHSCEECCHLLSGIPSDSDTLIQQLQSLAQTDSENDKADPDRRKALRALALGLPVEEPFLRKEEVDQPTRIMSPDEESSGEWERPRQVGDYRILQEVGRGGMGIVYKARDLRLRRLVALKFLQHPSLASRAQRRRFRLEAELAAQCRHPNVVQLYDAGTWEDDPFLVMEWVEGGSLAEKLQGQICTCRQAAQMVAALARAIHAAHQCGVVHRDLKPSNVLLARKELDSPSDREDCGAEPTDGIPWDQYEPKITDFGLARPMESEISLTETGAILGTPEYMAPEQAEGKRHLIGVGTDVYALGAILYRMLVGRPPFDQPDTPKILRAIVEEEPLPLYRSNAQIPRDLETICLKCLEKEPQQRYRSAEALARDLELYLEGKPVRARRVCSFERAWKWAQRRPAIAGLLLIVILLLLTGITVSSLFAYKAGQRADQAQKEAKAKEKALQETKAAQEASDLHAAQILFQSAYNECQSGNIANGMFTFLRAWKLSPVDARDFRRALRINLAAWSRQLPVLQQAFVSPDARGLRFINHGKELILLSSNRVQSWDPETGPPLGPPLLLPKEERVTDVSADGKFVAIQKGKVAQFRERKTGQKSGAVRELPSRANAAMRFTTLPEVVTQRMARSGRLLPPILWNRSTGKKYPVGLRLQPGETFHLTHDRQGKGVVILFQNHRGERDRSHSYRMRAHDLTSGTLIRPFQPLAGGSDPRISWDGRSVFSTSADGFRFLGFNEKRWTGCTVNWWSTQTGQLLESWSPRRDARHAMLTSDARLLVARCVDHRARLFDLSTGQQWGGDIPGVNSDYRVSPVSISPNGSLVASLSVRDGAPEHPSSPLAQRSIIRLWQLKGCQLQTSAAASPRRKSGHSGRPQFRRVAFHPEGKTVLISAKEGYHHARFIDVSTKQTVGSPLRYPAIALAAFSPDGRFAATASFNHGRGGIPILRFWSPENGSPLSPELRNPKFIHTLAFSPNGEYLAVGCVGGTFLWNAATHRLQRALPESTAATQLLFSPNGKQLAVGYRSGWSGPGAGFRLWDALTGKRISKFISTTAAPVMAFLMKRNAVLAFDPVTGLLHTINSKTGEAQGSPVPLATADQATPSPDGEYLATAIGSQVQQWDPFNGNRHGPVLEHPGSVVRIQYSRDNKMLAVLSSNNAIHLWDVKTALPLGPPLLHRSAVLGLHFTTDNLRLITVTQTGNVYEWHLRQPVAETPGQVELWIEGTGGIKAGGPGTVLLDVETWKREKNQLIRRPVSSLGGGTDSDREWHSSIARHAQENGETFTEVWHLKRLIHIDPDNWHHQARLGLALARAGSFEKAIAAFDQGELLGGGQALLDLYRNEVASLLGLSFWQEAEWYLNRLKSAGVDDWRFHADWAELSRAKNNPVEREVHLKRALARNPDREWLVAIGRDFAQNDEWQQSSLTLARLAQDPDAILDFLYYQALAALKVKDVSVYRRVCQRLLDRPLPKDPHLSATEVSERSWLFCLAPQAIQRWDKALDWIQPILKRLRNRSEQTTTRYRVTLAKWLQTEGMLLYRAGQHRKALRRLEESLVIRGGKGKLSDWLFLAMAYQSTGNSEAARELLERAIQTGLPAKAKRVWQRAELELLLEEAQSRIMPKAD